LPAPHLVDAGSIDAQLLLTSQHHYHIDWVGPVSQNQQWQVKTGGSDGSQFQVDWQRKQAPAHAEDEIFQQARLRQQTQAFQKLYAGRSGIEGVHSQAVRTMGLLRTR
jgi:hypothetical protein